MVKDGVEFFQTIPIGTLFLLHHLMQRQLTKQMTETPAAEKVHLRCH